MNNIPDSDGYADATHNSIQEGFTMQTSPPKCHVMLDLETTGTRPGCVIRSIGAATFNPMLLAMGDPMDFYTNITAESCRQAGLIIEPATQEWWDDPKRADARTQLLVDPRPLREAIEDFHEWFRAVNAQWVWGHGAAFDIPIWEAACRALGILVPWDFRDVRDTRTVFHLAGFDLGEIKRQGTYHNSLDDSQHQIKGVQLAIERMGLRK